MQSVDCEGCGNSIFSPRRGLCWRCYAKAKAAGELPMIKRSGRRANQIAFTGSFPRVRLSLTPLEDLDEKNTIMVVTHDIRAALSIADMIVVLGHARDVSGASSGASSGGTIIRTIDLAVSGFPCWSDNIYSLSEFSEMESQLSQLLMGC